MEIRLCKKYEMSLLIEFIRTYWNENHIFVKCPDLLIWQHANDDDTLNFLIATENNIIWAVLGFIPLSHFDKKLECYSEAWGALWKVRPDCKIPGLGTLLHKNLCKRYSLFGGIGLSEDNKSIHRSLKIPVYNVNQYFILNRTISDYHIAKIPRIYEFPVSNSVDQNLRVELCDTIRGTQGIKHKYHPIKSIEFIINRYEKHAWYKYFFLKVYDGNILVAIFVLKKIDVNERCVFRIIDFIGKIDNMLGFGEWLQNLFTKYPNCEYIDFYAYGIEEEFFINNGFVRNYFRNDLIIPNYFEPFAKCNVPLEGVVTITGETINNICFVKGDADQDRPNNLLYL